MKSRSESDFFAIFLPRLAREINCEKDSCFAGLFRVISRVSRAIFFLFLLALSAQAQGPAWWFARGAVDANLAANDYAPITCGQLKWIATNACAEMEAYFGAGSNVTSVVSAFPISSNYFLANLGQVKYVAQPFYDRLYDLNLTNTLPAGMPGYYPWGNSSETNDYAVANLGQVKYVFSFDSAVDSDGDGLSDWEEAEIGTDPYDPDTDGDGLSDGWEVEHGLDPLNASDGNQVLPLWLEQSRGQIAEHWNMIYTTPLVFTNTPGSQADLTDLKNALLGLSDVFFSSEVQ